MTYAPNISDPRVQRRFATVLAWAKPRLGWHHAEFVDSSELTRIFGNQTSSPLSAWLRGILLLREDTWIVGDTPYAYRINRVGVEYLLQLVARTEKL